MQLRDYQQNAIGQLRYGFTQGFKSQVLMQPTASGKTAIAATIIKNAVDKGGRAWFVVDNIELVDQTLETFEKFGLDVGVIQGEHEKTDYSKAVQVVTAQTITRRWHILDRHREWLPTIVLIDEAHCIYKAHSEIKGMLKGIPFLGLTATPFAKSMGKLYQNLVVGVDTATLIEQKYLCDYVAYAPYTPDLKGVKLQTGDYKTGDLAERLNTKQIVGSVVDTWLKRGENRQTICFAVNVAHSEAIADEFKANGVNAVHIDGYTQKDKRKEIIADFKSGKIKLLTSVGVLTKGFDAPDATCLIIARPTKSLMLHIQMLGRVLRKSSCGTDALILDHSGNLSRLGFPDDELPTELDSGEKVDRSQKAEDEKERAERAPKPCPLCKCLHNSFKCPQCGHAPLRQTEVEAIDGELKKVEKTPAQKRNNNTSKEDKQSFYSAAISYGQQKGYKDGWAAMQYKDRFSVFPNAYEKVSGVITDEFKNHITAKNIRFAKSRTNMPGGEDKNNGFHTSPIAGYEYTKKINSDGGLMIRVEQAGKFKGWAKQTPEMLAHVGESA